MSGVRPEDLPCGGCEYCVRAHQNCGSFIEEVDKAVPLAKGGMQGISLSCDDMGNRLGIRSGHGETGTVKKEKDGVSSQKSKNETIVPAVHVSPELSGFTGDAEMMDQLEHSVHTEVIFRDGEVHVLAVGTEGGEDNSELTYKASCWGFSLEDLREAQAKGQDLQFILEWLQSSAMPRQGDLFIANPAAKAYWLDKERFCLIEGVLYKEADSGDKKLVVPDSLKELAVKGGHDLPSSGHQGIARTKE